MFARQARTTAHVFHHRKFHAYNETTRALVLSRFNDDPAIQGPFTKRGQILHDMLTRVVELDPTTEVSANMDVYGQYKSDAFSLNIATAVSTGKMDSLYEAVVQESSVNNVYEKVS